MGHCSSIISSSLSTTTVVCIVVTLLLWCQTTSCLGAANIKAAPGIHHPLAKDIVGICLTYFCGTPGYTAKSGSSSIQTCSNCHPSKVDLPTSIDLFCRAPEQGGEITMPAGWVSLASSSARTSADLKLKKGETTRFAPQKPWDVARPLQGTEDAMDLTTCLTHGTGPDKVELRYIAYIGTPAFAKQAKLEVEAVDTRANYRPEKFVRRKRLLFGIKSILPLKARHAVVLTKSTTAEVADADSMIPEEMFETRLKCLQNKCALRSWFGCFHVVCRQAKGADLAMEEARLAIDEAFRQKALEMSGNKGEEQDQQQQQLEQGAPGAKEKKWLVYDDASLGVIMLGPLFAITIHGDYIRGPPETGATQSLRQQQRHLQYCCCPFSSAEEMVVAPLISQYTEQLLPEIFFESTLSLGSPSPPDTSSSGKNAPPGGDDDASGAANRNAGPPLESYGQHLRAAPFFWPQYFPYHHPASQESNVEALQQHLVLATDAMHQQPPKQPVAIQPPPHWGETYFSPIRKSSE